MISWIPMRRGTNENRILPALVLLLPSSSPSPGLGLPHLVRVNIVSKLMAPSKTLGKIDVVCREWQFCLGAVSNLVGVEFGECDRASLFLTIVWRSPVRSYHWAGPITGNQRFVSPDLNDRAIAVSDRCDQWLRSQICCCEIQFKTALSNKLLTNF